MLFPVFFMYGHPNTYLHRISTVLNPLFHYYINDFAQRCTFALRGGHLFLPAAVNPTIYRGGYFLFTAAGTFVRHGKSIYRGGHFIRPAAVNTARSRAQIRSNSEVTYIYKSLGFHCESSAPHHTSLPRPCPTPPLSRRTNLSPLPYTPPGGSPPSAPLSPAMRPLPSSPWRRSARRGWAAARCARGARLGKARAAALGEARRGRAAARRARRRSVR